MNGLLVFVCVGGVPKSVVCKRVDLIEKWFGEWDDGWSEVVENWVRICLNFQAFT